MQRDLVPDRVHKILIKNSHTSYILLVIYLTLNIFHTFSSALRIPAMWLVWHIRCSPYRDIHAEAYAFNRHFIGGGVSVKA